MKRKFWYICAILTFSIILSACSSGESTNTASNNNSSESNNTTNSESNEITELEIPLIAPFSGSVAFYGEGYIRGLNLALGEKDNVINGVKVSIEEYDDKCTPDEALNQVLKVVDTAKLTLGPACTANTLAVQGKLKEAGIPHIGLNYGSVAYNKGDNLIFSATPVDTDLAGAVIDFGLEQGVKKWAVINATDAYSASGAKTFSNIVKNTDGVEIVATATFNGGNREFKGILLNIQEENPDAIYIVGYEVDAGILVKQARQIGIETPVYGNAVFANEEFVEAAGEAAEGAYFSSVIIPDNPDPLVQEFVQKFKDEYGENPNDVATSGYTAGKIIISVLEQTGENITKEKIAEALRNMKATTPYGEIEYNDNGTLKGESLVVLGKIESGIPTAIEE